MASAAAQRLVARAADSPRPDPPVDQGEADARALNAAGVTVRHRCYDSLSHAFAAFTGAIPAANAACREIAGLVRGLYEERAAG